MGISINKKTVIYLAILTFLLISLPLVMWLIREQQLVKSRAGSAPISFQGANVSSLGQNQVFRLDDQGTPTVGLTLTSPFGAN